MTVSSIGGSAATAVQSLVDLRKTLDDLQRQLSTGQKSSTYAGLGVSRGVSVGLRSQLSAITAFDTSADLVQTRLSTAQTSLTRIGDLATSAKTTMLQTSYGSGAIGTDTAQSTGKVSLDETLSLLNTKVGDTYLFSGRATDTPAVETSSHILDGNGAQAGLKQVISERKQADLGASGLGRLTITTPTLTPETVNVDEDAASPFGFKLASVSGSLTNATVTGPTGSPAGISIDMSGGIPNDGDSVTMRFTLPDGTTDNLTLTATTTSPPGDNQFLIGADGATTATNLSAALNTSLGKLAGTSLTAASAVQASNDFFDNPPTRVTGPAFDSATTTAPGSSANTVIWYTGESGTDSARSTATARIDPNLVVGYGVRANEDALRNVVQNMATMAAVSIPSGGANSAGLTDALYTRLTTSLAGTPGQQSVASIETDLAGSQVAISAAKTRHQQQTATMSDYLQQIEGVSNEEVGASILTLQTRLQASMQVTSMMYQTSLVNYIK